MGFSIGGFAVAGAAAVDPRIAAVAVLEMQPTLAEELWNNHGRWGWLSGSAEEAAFRVAGVRVDEVRPLADLCRGGPRPLLLVYGSADRIAPAAGGERLLRACSGPRELLIVPGASHGGWEQAAPGLVPARLVRFFEGALRSP